MKDRITARLRGTQPAQDPEAEARSRLPPQIAALFPKPLVAAAVLMPLIERPAGLTVLLTRRSDHLRDHPGQISFPGGRLGIGEPPLAAALRETHEELGISPVAVEVAGYLPPQAVVTGFVVTPVVGFLAASVDLFPDAIEVAEVFEVPLDFVLDPANLVAGSRRFRDRDVPVWEYRYGTRRIWGATASMLNTFRMILF